MGPADAGYGVFTECTHMHCSLCHMQGVILHSEVYEEAKNRKKKKKTGSVFFCPFSVSCQLVSFQLQEWDLENFIQDSLLLVTYT